MANPEHVKIVKAGVEAILKARTDNPKLRLDLSRASLNGASLSGADLGRASLGGAFLREADLSDANLREASLLGASLSNATLSGADLQTANLHTADLQTADLQSADLDSANLSHANLGRTDFFEANLSGADLRGANLSEAKLCGANLGRADLRGANLQGADLTSADLTGSYWRATSIGNTCFDGVTTLAKTNHHGPSSLGLDTIDRAGNLPGYFLRGCGVPQSWIDYIPSLTGSAFQFYSCFISYNHDDKQFARQLHDRLQGKGIRCWLDEHAMVPGDDMYSKVDEGIRIWDKVLLCCSEASLKSPWVEREIDTAIEKEMDFQKSKGEQILKIIPLNLDGSLFDWTGSHAAILRKRLAADFTGWKSDADKFEQQFENVVKALRTDRGQLPPPKPILGS